MAIYNNDKDPNLTTWEGQQKNYTPDTSWLAGKYPEINAEINTRLPYVAIDEYFWQGEEADSVIQEIHLVWIKNNCTVMEAIKTWSSFCL